MKNKWYELMKFTFRQRKWIQLGIPALLLAAIFFLATLSNVFTKTYDIERFSNAKETIRSPITIENESETEQRIREAVASVEERYTISTKITQERVGLVNELFEALDILEEQEQERIAQEQIEKEQLEQELGEGKESPVVTEPETTTVLTDFEKVQQLNQLLSSELTQALEDDDLLKIVSASQNERSIAKELLTTSLLDVLNSGVRTKNVEAAKIDINDKLRYSSLGEDIKEALYALSDMALVENSFYDYEKTNEAQKQAITNVEPVMIRAGEVIVREGQTITNEIYEQLALVGLLNNDRNIYPVIGLVILVLLISGVATYELHTFSKKNLLDPGKIASIIIISVFMIAVMKTISVFAASVDQVFLLVPAVTGAMLLKILINERLAIVMAIIYSILGSVIFNLEIPGALNMEAALYFFLSQMAGIVLLINLKDRTAILKAGAGIVVVQVLTVLIFLFLSFEKYTITDALVQSGFALAAAFLSIVLTIGMLPIFETGLGILSDTKLLTLSSPNHPLLRKILTEAPGTYHHSVMVANLSEASCEAIGANGLLARVASYYHDLGKTVRPHYFIENQMGIQNPHDLIEPKQSADIIISHPYDGAALLKKQRLPKEIIDIAEQHHGTTLLKYFYFKAKDKYKNLKESDFRYPGPKPRSKEAAIVSICDSVEAAVRSLQEPTKEKIENIVTSIINDRLMDGQLNDSSLTFHELDRIHIAICETLNGIFHSRIQYPDDKVKEAN
ncbi:HD family phosphohydrolase [Radiobacillus sp. PE A8.2]|uniref:HD family phosphohydrolase n=1 Tax=Radiobacillus sp. PE A8.2 TaxID=3380349 RepID=UPI00388E026A